ncbi:DNA repair protein RAD51 4 [Liparis tanakae]|uniref:DNA repair protein RAD51 4 n=1 Tax=Liparis tanakae TaxID=230148 RepID=A0A4Z2FEZ3_9TELE|nr:DNA repair protein RAD51 4 [Liparis tanakae]
MSLMMQVAGVLKALAKDFNVAALVTNHVTRGGGGELQPGLGASWGPVPRTRVLLERAEGAADGGHSSIRTATLIKSSRRPCLLREEFDLRRWSRSGEEGSSSSGKRTLEETDS